MSDQKFNRYLFEYRYGGAEWAFEIIATSPEEARERLKAISWAQYKGEIFAKISASSEPVSRLARRVASLFRLR